VQLSIVRSSGTKFPATGWKEPPLAPCAIAGLLGSPSPENMTYPTAETARTGTTRRTTTTAHEGSRFSACLTVRQ
jgi:hypothetical protein